MAHGSSTVDHAAYAAFTLLGASTLCPWNAVITAADWWEFRYPGQHTDRLLTICYLPVNLAVIAAMVLWHDCLRPRWRILGGLLGFTLAMSLIPLLNMAPANGASLAALLLLVAACGACDGLAQGALFGEAAALPPLYTQALVGGTALSGVAVSALRIATKATLPPTEGGLRASADAYFFIAALVSALCAAVYAYVLPRLPAVRQGRQAAALEAALHDYHYHQEQQEQHGAALLTPPPPQYSLLKQAAEAHMPGAGASGKGLHSPSLLVDLELSVEEPPPYELQDLVGGIATPPWQRFTPGGGGNGGGSCSGSDGWHTPPMIPAAGARSSNGGGGGGGGRGGAALSTASVALCMWRPALALTLIYTVTLCIFPGVLAEDVQSAQMGSWYPVALIAAYNLADWAGKSLPGVPALRLSDAGALLAAAAARMLFVPAFHFAAMGGAGPAIIGALASFLGLSSGYLTACAMILGPAMVPPGSAAAALAGNLMVLALVTGLCLGAFAGFLWLL